MDEIAQLLNFQNWVNEMLARSKDDGASHDPDLSLGQQIRSPLHPRRRRKLPPAVLAFRLSLLRLPLGSAELGAINPDAVHDRR